MLACMLVGLTQQAGAYSVNDKITIGGITYNVTGGYNVTAINTTLTGEITIPETVFDGQDVTFTVTGVGFDESPQAWSGVTAVNLPSTLKTINRGAFFGSSITRIHIPASVKEISSLGLTYGMSKLAEITVDESNSYFKSVDNVLYSKDGKELVAYPRSRPLDEENVFRIPEGVEVVRGMAFNSISALKTLYVPKTVLTYNAVSTCTNLENVFVDDDNPNYCDVDGVVFDKEMTTLLSYPPGKTATSYSVPDGIKTVESNAFSSARFSTVDLNGVETLKDAAFNTCVNLTSITIPSNMSNIPEGAIAACSQLTNYYVAEGNETYKDIDGVLYSADGKTLIIYPMGRNDATYVIAEGATAIAGKAFASAKIKEIEIPKDISDIGEGAFQWCQNLETVTFEEPSELTEIKMQVFYFSHIQELTLPKSVAYIRNQSFQASGIKEVVVPEGSALKSIGGAAFIGTGIEHFTFEGDCPLTTIGSEAFSGCAKLEEFNFPATVTTIGSSAFYKCKSLSSITFADDAVITTIGSKAFSNSGLVSLTIPESVTSIEMEAFRECDVLESINVGKNVTNIHPQAFKFCSKLKNINVDKENGKYSSVDGVLLSKNKRTLMLFPPGKANDRFTLLPPSITTIGDYAFYSCENLKNVTIPNLVTTIGKRAFGLCTNLNTITFLCHDMISPDNIATALNEAAFDDGVTTAEDKRGDINIYVHESQLDDYQAEPFYQKFKSIATSFTNGSEEYIAVSDNAVDLLSTSTTDETYIIPRNVNHDGRTYEVALVGDYAFRNTSSNVKEVVLFDNVEYIGAKAFLTDITNNTSTVERMFFIGSTPSTEMLSTTRFELDATGSDYSEIAGTTNIYVKKSKLEGYKTAMPRYAEQMDYKIPFPMTSKYGTFCREFDTDFSELTSTDNEGMPQMIAFTAGKYGRDIDKNGDEILYVHMESINLGDAQGDGTFIPANTAVLIRATGDVEGHENDYYQIHDDNLAEYSRANIMKGVTVRPAIVQPTEDSFTNFLMSTDSKLHKMTVARTFPTHKAYMQLPTEDIQNAKIAITFEEPLMGNDESGKKPLIPFEESEEITNAIFGINNDAGKQGEWYTLQGVKTNNPSKGIYIHDGKKVVVE